MEEVQDDPYVILGVGRDASEQQLRRARNELLQRWHPDRTDDPSAAEQAARINAAYEVLHDPGRRAEFDRAGATASLGAMLAHPAPFTWTPAVEDEVRAAAQQRVVDRFRDAGPAPRGEPRRWSDTIARPRSFAEIRGRLLRAVPFAVLAVVSYLALPAITQRVPGATVAADALPLFAVVAVVRAALGRVTRFADEAWGRFTLSWIVGVAALMATDRWAVPRLPASLVSTIQPVAPVVLLLVAALVVYGLARTLRRSL